MNDSLILGLAGVAGLALGVIFFGGLWWTIRRGARSPRPAVWFLGSALSRMAVALAGFYFVSGGAWQRLVAGLVGFIVARLFVAQWVRSMSEAEDAKTATK